MLILLLGMLLLLLRSVRDSHHLDLFLPVYLNRRLIEPLLFEEACIRQLFRLLRWEPDPRRFWCVLISMLLLLLLLLLRRKGFVALRQGLKIHAFLRSAAAFH